MRRSFVAHNSHYETCVAVRSLAMLLLPENIRYTLSVKVRRSFVAHNSVSNWRYWLKFGDAFAAQTYQICVIGESAVKFCGQ